MYEAVFEKGKIEVARRMIANGEFVICSCGNQINCPQNTHRTLCPQNACGSTRQLD